MLNQVTSALKNVKNTAFRSDIDKLCLLHPNNPQKRWEFLPAMLNRIKLQIQSEQQTNADLQQAQQATPPVMPVHLKSVQPTLKTPPPPQELYPQDTRVRRGHVLAEQELLKKSAPPRPSTSTDQQATQPSALHRKFRRLSYQSTRRGGTGNIRQLSFIICSSSRARSLSP